MSEPVSTSFIFVDRRKTGRGKSLNNRQKLLRRIKESIKNSKPQDIDSLGVTGGSTPAGTNPSNNSLNSPVRVAKSALAEPWFHYSSNVGNREVVLIGNDRWLKNDDFPLSSESEDEEPGAGGPGDDGEDDFIVNISRNEFLEIFFEDCELPDLIDNHERVLPSAVMKPAGFQKNGNPGQISVIRSYKNSMARRIMLTKTNREKLAELEKELHELEHKV